MRHARAVVFQRADQPFSTAPQRCRGITLIELLVVIVIVMLLASIGLRALRPAADSRRMREAARMVTTLLHGAKVRAIETGRPYGVWFEPFDGPSEASRRLSREVYLAEVPPVYSGDTAEAHAKITPSNAGRDGQQAEGANLELATGTAQLVGASDRMIESGDFIRFGFQEPRFRVVSASSSQVTFTATSGPLPRETTDARARVPFQVFRRPRRARFENPVQLPGNAVVDLSQSGMRGTEFGSDGDHPLIVMFSPNGGLERLYLPSGESIIPISSIFLLIGKGQKVGVENIRDPANLWIAIGHQTGVVTTAANRMSDNLDEARQPARTHHGIGGG